MVINESRYVLVVNDKEFEDRNDSDIFTNTVRMRDMKVYTYIHVLFIFTLLA